MTAPGSGARGIQATAVGAGRATVLADGGTVTASYDDADDVYDGIGIHAFSGAAASM